MNRLILIGNGFDLAHNLETKYQDFILGYLKRSFRSSVNGGSYEDDLISVRLVSDVSYCTNQPSFNGVEEMVEYFFKIVGIFSLSENKIYLPGRHTMYYFYNPFRFTVQSDFFRDLLTKCADQNWVDIENEYYDELKSILKIRDDDDKLIRLNELNKSLECLIKGLHVYLSRIEKPTINPGILNIFDEKILEREIDEQVRFEDRLPEETYILNFNYTDTIDLYTSLLPKERRYRVNYIHGKIDDLDNRLVFGFGDELDPDYETMEKERTKGFFKFIKSFWYFRTKNYHELTRFIDSDPFQVFVWGHSCGLSDRTMLNMIFEHKNCKSIKIFYYEKDGWDNYTEVTEEISRHFSDKKAMRKKIVNYKYSTPLPQQDSILKN